MQEIRTKERRTGGETEPRARRWTGAHALMKGVTHTPILVMLVAVWIMFIFLNKMFLTGNNMVTLFVVNSFFAVAAIGEAFVLMTGGIDLSIAHNLTCSSIVSALLMISFQTNSVNALVNPGGPIVSLSELSALPGMDPQALERALSATAGSTIAIGIVSAIAVGLLFGTINGVAIGFFRMTPFIITLGTQLLARGISFVLSNGISTSGTPRELAMLSYAYGIPITGDFIIPWVILIVVAIFLVFGILLGKTTWGRYVTLTGSNPQSAAYVGIRVPWIICSVYMVAGLLAGIGGFLTIMCFGTADVKVGDPLLLPVIGSVILGGVATTGGEGTIVKAALGILMFATIINGMTFLNLTLSLQQIILGAIIVIGMALLARFRVRRN